MDKAPDIARGIWQYWRSWNVLEPENALVQASLGRKRCSKAMLRGRRPFESGSKLGAPQATTYARSRGSSGKLGQQNSEAISVTRKAVELDPFNAVFSEENGAALY